MACTKAAPPPPSAAGDAKADEPKIHAILEADKRFNDALSEAETKQDADLLEKKAMPAADESAAGILFGGA